MPFVVHFEWNGKSLDSPEGLSYKKVTVLKIATGQVHAFQENPNYDGHLILFTEKFVLNYFSKSTIEFIPHLYNYHINEPLVEGGNLNEVFLWSWNTTTPRQKEIS